MALDFKPERDVMGAFATPIAVFDVPDPAALNAGLRAIVLERAETTAGVGRTNVGGWHSPDDLLTWPDPAVATLKDHVMGACQTMLAVISNAQRYDCTMNLACWANVLRKGNYNVEHVHPEATVSGVYYVDVGDSDPNDRMSGRFEFLDPRHIVQMAPMPDGAAFGRAMPVQPSAGMMMLFPSWLHHAVRPYNGDRPRISIAFNAIVTNFRRT